ncbi:MAG: amidohydrolase family protein, partial [Anaerolineaceae bacterium]
AEKTKLEPSEYMKRNVFYVVEPREPYVDHLMDSLGESQFLWGSDYPHIDSSENALEQVKANAAKLSDRRRRRLLGENARALYNLDA